MDVEEFVSDQPTIVYDVKPTESAENFQKFIYELFEKNGVLNDLRSYLRGHIVNVTKHAQTGTTPLCQKNFTQRLELKYQALNILIAEYLLQMDFTYSFSVFISEMPLTNMVFNFAKTLVKKPDVDITKLKFDDGDVWSVLNYLGIECDKECATTILNTYRNEDLPLLSCILNTVKLPNRRESTGLERDASESVSQSSSMRSSVAPARDAASCRHVELCDTCHSKYKTAKVKYREKKSKIEQSKIRDPDGIDIDKLLKNMSLVETTLVDEMLEQVTSAYESEIELLRAEERRRAAELAQRAQELERSYREKEATLEAGVRQKNQLLFNLAQNLKKEQKKLRVEEKRLIDKEENLKQQLLESEKMLREHGLEMKTQITSELSVLENHLETMKIEREKIAREKAQLESVKNSIESTSKTMESKKVDDANKRFDILKNEIKSIKDYLKTNSRNVLEQSTLTELFDVNSNLNIMLNNVQEVEERISKRPQVLVNDLKKNNNVNVCTPNVVGVDNGCLRDENCRLRALTIQQRNEIASLSSHGRVDGVAAGGTWGLPGGTRGAPNGPFNITVQSRLSTSPVTVTPTHNGAGEQLSVFVIPRTRVLLPGEAIPFVGSVGTEGRRHLISQWRALRRPSPPRGARRRAKEARDKHAATVGANRKKYMPSTSSQKNNDNELQSENIKNGDKSSDHFEATRDEILEQSPTRDAGRKSSNSFTSKGELRNKSKTLETPPRRQGSPSVLREAKLRLRKLEIEAEAVERSYNEYRRRRGDPESKPSQASSKISEHKLSDLITPIRETRDSCSKGVARLLEGRPSKDLHNKAGTINAVRPIPKAYSEDQAKEHKNYLETPLNEFRKLYISKIDSKPVDNSVLILNEGRCDLISDKHQTNTLVNCEVETNIELQDNDKNKAKHEPNDNKNKAKDEQKELKESGQELIKTVKTEQAEYVILVENANKLYNITKTDSADSQVDEQSKDLKVEENKFVAEEDKLIIEVEKVKASSGPIQVNSSEDYVFEIESAVATEEEKEILSTEPEEFFDDVKYENDQEVPKENIEIEELYQATNNTNVKSVESTSNKGDEEYPDDFTPEIESDDSISHGIPSPISLGQSVTNDDFWD